jgi:muconate cycloisomerase
VKIDSVRIYPIVLPFSSEFSHSQRKRSHVKNVVVEVSSDNGRIMGYGEGAPRSYVTGETQESVVRVLRHLTEKDDFPWELEGISRVWEFVDSLPGSRESNSAACALELSLLDAVAKAEGEYAVDYFGTGSRQQSVSYGAVLPLASSDRIYELCRFAKGMGIHRIKLKIGEGLAENRASLEAVRRVFGEDCDILLDVNMAWDLKLAVLHAPLIREIGVRVVEQPMAPGNPDIKEFSALMKACGVILMADESACTLEEAKTVLGEGCYEMMHVRLSKCGGLRKSLQIIDYLRQEGISFAVGCQLGESGILSAAGRLLSLLAGDARYFNCCYDDFLLKENVTYENVSFGMGGKAGPLNRPGLGVRVNTEALKRLSAGAEVVTVNGP